MKNMDELMNGLVEKVIKYGDMAEVAELLRKKGLDNIETYDCLSDDMNEVVRDIQEDMAMFRLTFLFRCGWDDKGEETNRWVISLGEGKDEIDILEGYSIEFIKWLARCFEDWSTHTMTYDPEDKWIEFRE